MNKENTNPKARLVEKLKEVPNELSNEFTRLALEDVKKLFEREPSKTEAAYLFYKAYLTGYIHSQLNEQNEDK